MFLITKSPFSIRKTLSGDGELSSGGISAVSDGVKTMSKDCLVSFEQSDNLHETALLEQHNGLPNPRSDLHRPPLGLHLH
jgi:hypothetical protein